MELTLNLGKGHLKNMKIEETLSDDDVVARLNEIDKKKCRFGANIEELENEQKELINILKNRGYEINVVNIN